MAAKCQASVGRETDNDSNLSEEFARLAENRLALNT